MDKSITFIGSGNMARAIIKGLLENQYTPSEITVCSPNIHKIESLTSAWHVQTSTNNIEAVKSADVVVLAVKPAQILTVCDEIKSHIKNDALIISVAAGVSIAALADALSNQLKQPKSSTPSIVRSMPNTPSQIQLGATGLFANDSVTLNQKQWAETIFSSVGLSQWVEEESHIDVVTALSGSGPAYFFLFIESMIDAAQKMGLDKKTAETLALQTAYGATALAKNTNTNVTTLRKQVTSPNGTTEQAIRSFESEGMREIVFNAMTQANKRAKEISTEFLN